MLNGLDDRLQIFLVGCSFFEDIRCTPIICGSTVRDMVKDKKIVLGVSGGIAAYKAVTLCSRLVQAGAHVRVIMTESATQFVTPLTFQTISRSLVATDTFEERDPSVVSHIDTADWADLVVVAPATANILAKMAHGLADDMLSTTLLATQAPVLVAPAMNVHMYAHPAVQSNMDILRARGVHFIDPGVGSLACGYTGKGRLAEPEMIYEHIAELMNSDVNELHSPAAMNSAAELMDVDMSGLRVMITAGGTIERIDPVRYITNDSSGKMGYALAEAAAKAGAQVTLISANVNLPSPAEVKVVPVTSAQDMYDAVMEYLPETDLVIKAAAVADYRPVQEHKQKLKKQADKLVLELEKTPDILQAIGKNKSHQFVVGFAAETHDIERHALDKLQRKNCDLLIANDVSQKGIGFGSDDNAVYVYAAEGLIESIPMMSKHLLSVELLRLIASRMSRFKEEA